jgi:hypothetical protein
MRTAGERHFHNARRFTKRRRTRKIEMDQNRNARGTMPLSGEAIRLMNYVDDVATTLRRVLFLAPTLTDAERKRLGEYLRHSEPNVDAVLAALDKK